MRQFIDYQLIVRRSTDKIRASFRAVVAFNVLRAVRICRICVIGRVAADRRAIMKLKKIYIYVKLIAISAFSRLFEPHIYCTFRFIGIRR